MLCLLLLSTAVTPITAVSSEKDFTVNNPPGNEFVIKNSSISGPGIIRGDYNTTHLWQSQPYNLTVSLYTGSRSGTHNICAKLKGEGNNSTALGCQAKNLSSNTSQKINFTFANSSNISGDQTLVMSVNKSKKKSKIIARSQKPVTILRKKGDPDGDGLINKAEVKHETNVSERDTDNDGLNDYEEVKEYNTNPLKNDTDSDGLRDPEEISKGTNPNKKDTDSDGLHDGAEIANETNASNPDTDNDGLIDVKEVNGSTDPTKKDTDADDLSDYKEVVRYNTDPTEPDSDNDSLNDSTEIKKGTDPTDADTDNDGLADGKEIEIGTNPRKVDTDGDGLSDGFEYRFGTNPTSPLFTGGLYLLLLGILGGAAILVGRSENKWVRQLRNNDQRQSEVPPQSADDSPDITTDADRVLELLQANGGRLPQTKIIEETEWSKSKVSRLLSEMENNEQISKINIGRKNIVLLYGTDIENEQPPGN